MGLPLADGLAVLYVLFRDWMTERETLAALGVKDPDRVDDLLGLTGGPGPTAVAMAGKAGRRAQVAAMGGEIA